MENEMTAEEEFEEWRITIRGLDYASARLAYLAATVAERKRTAQQCVEICDDKSVTFCDSASQCAQAIKERFLK
jgi:hypothetical protein